MQLESTASTGEWIRSVATVLPLEHRDPLPYTLGEAVAEFGAYAHAIDGPKWNLGPSRDNRRSLRNEIAAQAENLGQELGALLAPMLADLNDDTDPQAVSTGASRFSKVWHSEVAIGHAFQDLCAAAKIPGTTSRALRALSAIIASQVGPAARGGISILSQAADVLVDADRKLNRRQPPEIRDPLSEAGRLRLATDILISAPTGQTVVWMVYHRALISGVRTAAGPITFLRADWALPNAFGGEPRDFPEAAELRDMRENVFWLDDLNEEALKLENRVVLVRVELGERQVAGAIEEGRRRLDAVLSLAVASGGTSWRRSGGAIVLLNGEVRGYSSPPNMNDAPPIGESYGIGITAEALENIADQLGAALTQEPMPDQLVEALSALREARMTADHRDVSFYKTRRVTARVATALEDHAMELIASVIRVTGRRLADALQRRQALTRAGHRIALQLMAPFGAEWQLDNHDTRAQIEEEIASYRQGAHLVSVPKAINLQTEIRALPMSTLQRADVEDAFSICTNPERERQMLEEIWRETSLLRARHRRVRNAVNHGLPLGATTLASVRDYADKTSVAALNMAIHWFQSKEPGDLLLRREDEAWDERMARINRGISWASADSQTMDGS
jgi:hypothetical protein